MFARGGGSDAKWQMSLRMTTFFRTLPWVTLFTELRINYDKNSILNSCEVSSNDCHIFVDLILHEIVTLFDFLHRMSGTIRIGALHSRSSLLHWREIPKVNASPSPGRGRGRERFPLLILKVIWHSPRVVTQYMRDIFCQFSSLWAAQHKQDYSPHLIFTWCPNSMAGKDILC